MKFGLALLVVLGFVPASLPAQSCQVGANGIPTLVRTGGNQITGTAGAYPAQTVMGDFQITLTVTILKVGSTSTQVAQSSHMFNWPSGTAAGTQNTIQHTVATDLETYGPGTYQVRQETTAVCNGQMIPVNPNPIYSSAISVSRPSVHPTGLGASIASWAFWYLGGAPSVDGYLTQVALSGEDNWAGPVSSRTWAKVNQPNKISLSTTSGPSTLVTSQAASNGTTFDISVVYSIDGFKSAPFLLHINRANSLSQPTYIHTDNDTCAPGWKTTLDYEMRDLWGYILIEHATNEVHTNHSSPSGVNWNAQQNWNSEPLKTVWNKGDRDEWVDQYVFRDTISAGNCGNNLSPAPVSAGANGYDEGTPTAPTYKLTSTQGIYSGSTTNGQGQLVQSKTMRWFLDHGRVQ